MFHKAINLNFNKGTTIDVSFESGEIKRFDISSLFSKYPQLKALENRKLFKSGKLMGPYGIVWNDELDIETETIYEDGILIERFDPPSNADIGRIVSRARAYANMSQTELSGASGIDQSDISKIERGIANPSVSTLKRLAKALNADFKISLDPKK